MAPKPSCFFGDRISAGVLSHIGVSCDLLLDAATYGGFLALAGAIGVRSWKVNSRLNLSRLTHATSLLSCPEMKRLVSASSAHASTSSHSKCAALATIGRRARDGRLVVRGTPRWAMPPACIDIKALVIEVSQSRLA